MSRLSEILGVKEGQEFKYGNDLYRYKVNDNLLDVYIFTDKCWRHNYGLEICDMIAHPELIHPISEKPQLTEQQITAIKGRIAEGTPWAARGKEGTLFFYENKPKLSYDQTYFYSEEKYRFPSESDLYDFITFENSPVYLPEFVEESEK